MGSQTLQVYTNNKTVAQNINAPAHSNVKKYLGDFTQIPAAGCRQVQNEKCNVNECNLWNSGSVTHTKQNFEKQAPLLPSLEKKKTTTKTNGDNTLVDKNNVRIVVLGKKNPTNQGKIQQIQNIFEPTSPSKNNQSNVTHFSKKPVTVLPNLEKKKTTNQGIQQIRTIFESTLPLESNQSNVTHFLNKPVPVPPSLEKRITTNPANIDRQSEKKDGYIPPLPPRDYQKDNLNKSIVKDLSKKQPDLEANREESRQSYLKTGWTNAELTALLDGEEDYNKKKNTPNALKHVEDSIFHIKQYIRKNEKARKDVEEKQDCTIQEKKSKLAGLNKELTGFKKKLKKLQNRKEKIEKALDKKKVTGAQTEKSVSKQKESAAANKINSKENELKDLQSASLLRNNDPNAYALRGAGRNSSLQQFAPVLSQSNSPATANVSDSTHPTSNIKPPSTRHEKPAEEQQWRNGQISAEDKSNQKPSTPPARQPVFEKKDYFPKIVSSSLRNKYFPGQIKRKLIVEPKRSIRNFLIKHNILKSSFMHKKDVFS